MFAFMPRNLHVWEMFIKPRELKKHLVARGFENRNITGLAPAVNPLAMLFYLRKRAKGQYSIRQLGQKLKLRESRDKSMLYLGWAVLN